MKVETLVEHEDGSATVQFDLTSEETSGLLKYALTSILCKTALLTKMETEETIEKLNTTD
jgi:hypothetical protein